MEAAGKIFAVAIGGAIGAVARYLINISPLAGALGKFPLPTFVINVSGSFLIGFLMMWLAGRFETNDNLRLVLLVGFLGAFTTFSTFEAEIYTLLREREVLIGPIYLFSSILLGFLGMAAGVEIGRRFQ